MLAPNTITITRQPYNFMPVGNPIQYLIASNRTHEWSEYGCSVGPVIPSQYGVWELYIDYVPNDGDALVIDGEIYIFRFCNPRQLATVIDMSAFLMSGNYCDLALEIVETINNNPRARNRYFASPLGVVYSFGAALCDAVFLDLFIVAKRIGLDLNPFYRNILTSIDTQLPNIALPQATYYTNYRVKIVPYMESTEHNYLQYVELPTLSALPKYKSGQGLDNVLDPEREFEFDIRNVLKIFLDEDVPVLDLYTTQFAMNCIKRVYVRYGDTYNQRADIGGFDSFASKLKLAQEFRVLNASFELYRSNLYTHRTDNGFSCVSDYAQDYLLKPFFESDLMQDQRFLTNWKHKPLYQNDYEFLYFWLRFTVDVALLRAVVDLTYNDGTTSTQISAFNFADYGPCDAPAQIDEQIVMIPLHIILNDFDMRNVSKFCFYLEHPDCFIPAGYGLTIIGFTNTGGASVGILNIGSCLSIDFQAAFCTTPFGETPQELMASFYDVLQNCPSPTLYALRQNKTYILQYEPGSEVLFMYVKDCCTPTTPQLIGDGDLAYFATPTNCCDETAPHVRISEKLTYNYNFVCIENRVGLMYLNALGVNEMFYLNGALIKQLQAERNQYLRNILNNDETRNLPNDREQITVSADGENAYEIRTLLSTDEERGMVKELFHSPRVRLIETVCLTPQCGEATICLPCNNESTQHFTPYPASGTEIRCNYYLDLEKDNLEYVQYPDIPAYHWGCADTITIEAWIRVKSFSTAASVDWSIIMAKQSSGAKEENYPAMFFFFNAAGQLGVYFGARRILSTVDDYLGFTAPALSISSWKHVAWVRPANSILSTDQLVYVNGVHYPITSSIDSLLAGDCSLYDDQLNPARKNDGPITIGVDFDCNVPRSPSYFNNDFQSADMQIAGFRIYKRGLSQAELAANWLKGFDNCPTDSVTNPASLILNSTFNHQSGYFVADLALGNNGALIPLNSYSVPLDAEVGCTPTTIETFGYPADRVAADGGAWIDFKEDEFACCKQVPLESVCKDILTPVTITDKSITVQDAEEVSEFTLKFEKATTHNALRGA